MLRVSRLLILVVAALGPALAEAATGPTDRAREVLKLYLDGRFAEFVAEGDATVQEKLTTAQLAQISAQLEAVVGKYVGESEVKLTPAPPADTIAFVLRHERGFVDMTVILDSDSKVSGFWCKNVRPLADAKPPAYADPASFSEEDVTVKCAEFELPGKLTLPKEGTRHPAVVLVHGSGPHDADENVFGTLVFRDLAWGLATKGVAVLRYEKRSHKYGQQMDPYETTLATETIDDALAAVALLRDRPDVDPARIFVLGHSLGGLAAPYVASRDPKLAGIIVLAGSGRPLGEVIVEQITYISNVDGQINAEEQQAIDDAKAGAAKLASGEFTREDRLLGVPLQYWADIDKHNGPEEARRLDRPILVLQGGRDYQVNMKCYERWQAALKDRPNVRFKVFGPLNHLMVAGEGPSSPQEYFTPQNVDQAVVDEVATWVRATPAGG